MRKILAVLLSCVLMTTAIASVAAVSASAEEAIVFTAQSVTAKPGDTVTVDISVSENHYMVNGQIWIKYDPTVLEIQEVWDDEDNPYFEDINTKIFKGTYMWAFAVPQAGTAKMAFATSSAKGTTQGGVMFTLTFKVLDTAENSEITFEVPEMCSNDGVTNAGEDFAVEPSFVNGVVTIEKEAAPVKGDINGDGSVALADANRLFYYVNGAGDLSEEEIARADINGDGVVTLFDAAWVFYQVAGV